MNKFSYIPRQYMTGKLLVVMFGIRRSGNHMIRDWIEYQFPRPTDNMVNHGLDFYMAYVQGENAEYVNCRVVSIEEYPIRSVYVPLKYGHDEIKRVVVLRDPYNLFASRYKFYMCDKRYENPNFITYLWVDYAKFFLSKPKDVICVSYNEFVKDELYRRELCAKLGGEFNDKPINFVNDRSGGSSFDGAKYMGRASEMKVFERWKHFYNDYRYKNLFTKEIKSLSKKIFNFQPF